MSTIEMIIIHFTNFAGLICTEEVPRNLTTDALRSLAIKLYFPHYHRTSVFLTNAVTSQNIDISNRITLDKSGLVDENIVQVTSLVNPLCPIWFSSDTTRHIVRLNGFETFRSAFVPHYEHSLIIYSKINTEKNVVAIVAVPFTDDEAINIIVDDILEVIYTQLFLRENRLFIICHRCDGTVHFQVVDTTQKPIKDWSCCRMLTFEPHVVHMFTISSDGKYVGVSSRILGQNPIVRVFDIDAGGDPVIILDNLSVDQILIENGWVVLMDLCRVKIFRFYDVTGRHLHTFTYDDETLPLHCHPTLDKIATSWFFSIRPMTTCVYSWSIECLHDDTIQLNEKMIHALDVAPGETVFRCGQICSDTDVELMVVSVHVEEKKPVESFIYELWKVVDKNKCVIARFSESDTQHPFFISPCLTQVCYALSGSTTDTLHVSVDQLCV